MRKAKNRNSPKRGREEAFLFSLCLYASFQAPSTMHYTVKLQKEDGNKNFFAHLCEKYMIEFLGGDKKNNVS